jgi:hypothetical protein
VAASIRYRSGLPGHVCRLWLPGFGGQFNRPIWHLCKRTRKPGRIGIPAICVNRPGTSRVPGTGKGRSSQQNIQAFASGFAS